jgi:hypothetical protein
MPYNLQEIRNCSESQPRVFWHYVFKSTIGDLIVKISINFKFFLTKDIFLSKFGMLLASKHFYSKVKLKLNNFFIFLQKLKIHDNIFVFLPALQIWAVSWVLDNFLRQPVLMI